MVVVDGCDVSFSREHSRDARCPEVHLDALFRPRGRYHFGESSDRVGDGSLEVFGRAEYREDFFLPEDDVDDAVFSGERAARVGEVFYGVFLVHQGF